MGGLEDLKRSLGVNVEGGLLETALTHASFANENPAGAPGGDNERLEFLGDAVLQYVTGQHLFRRFPGASAGELTRLRAQVVSEEALYAVAQDLDLGRWLRLGRGEEASGGRQRRSVLADAFEALVGAIYLSAGIREVQRFVVRALGPALEAAAGRSTVDPKTALQEAVQAKGGTVAYRILSASGPDHARVYEAAVLVDGVEAGRGTGRTKKEAQREAATRALAARQPG